MPGPCSVSSFLRILPADILENALAMVSPCLCLFEYPLICLSIDKMHVCQFVWPFFVVVLFVFVFVYSHLLWQCESVCTFIYT